MTSEETIENQAKEIASLKADVALLKETLTHGLACMKTAREVHKADVAVIRADHKAETSRLHGVVSRLSYDLERRGNRIANLKAEMLSNGIRYSDTPLGQRLLSR